MIRFPWLQALRWLLLSPGGTANLSTEHGRFRICDGKLQRNDPEYGWVDANYHSLGSLQEMTWKLDVSPLTVTEEDAYHNYCVLRQASNVVRGDTILYHQLAEISNRIHAEQLGDTQKKALAESPPTDTELRDALCPAAPPEPPSNIGAPPPVTWAQGGATFSLHRSEQYDETSSPVKMQYHLDYRASIASITSYQDATPSDIGRWLHACRWDQYDEAVAAFEKYTQPSSKGVISLGVDGDIRALKHLKSRPTNPDAPKSFQTALAEMQDDPTSIWICSFDSKQYRWDPIQQLLLITEDRFGGWNECRYEFNLLVNTTWTRLP